MCVKSTASFWLIELQNYAVFLIHSLLFPHSLTCTIFITSRSRKIVPIDMCWHSAKTDGRLQKIMLQLSVCFVQYLMCHTLAVLSAKRPFTWSSLNAWYLSCIEHTAVHCCVPCVVCIGRLSTVHHWQLLTSYTFVLLNHSCRYWKFPCWQHLHYTAVTDSHVGNVIESYAWRRHDVRSLQLFIHVYSLKQKHLVHKGPSSTDATHQCCCVVILCLVYTEQMLTSSSWCMQT